MAALTLWDLIEKRGDYGFPVPLLTNSGFRLRHEVGCDTEGGNKGVTSRSTTENTWAPSVRFGTFSLNAACAISPQFIGCLFCSYWHATTVMTVILPPTVGEAVLKFSNVCLLHSGRFSASVGALARRTMARFPLKSFPTHLVPRITSHLGRELRPSPEGPSPADWLKTTHHAMML